MRIRPMEQADLPALMEIWNACVDAGEVLYYPLTPDYFHRKFAEGPWCEKENLLVAEEQGAPVGMIHGVAPETFPLARPGHAYLTCLLVDRAFRGRGVGRALLNALKEQMKKRGAHTLFISSLNPVNLDWRIPGTPGHDHNNMPGLDAGCAGSGFFAHMGFETRHQEMAMYGDVTQYHLPPDLPQWQEKLRAQGIETGLYDGHSTLEFDRMCDRVGSDYWRDVLRTELAAWQSGAPNADPRMWADGRQPSGPRPLLLAVHEGHIVGFTGPVDKQKSGRGWFTGICTDPAFERRGIAKVLFNLLMREFALEGAQFATLFTGTDNHAQKIYRSAGLRPVRTFTLMSLSLEGGEQP